MSAPFGSTKLAALSSLKPVGVKPLEDKFAKLGGASAVGKPVAGPQVFADGVSYLQEYGSVVIFYNPAYGAVSIDQAIYAKWKSPSVSALKASSGVIIRDYLGFPVSDSFSTVESGGTAAYFERGMIVVRANQQAYVVYGPIYEHYRRLGDIGDASDSLVVGLPASDEQPTASGGRMSQFDAGDIYWTAETGAREIHGAIRDRWLAMGGPESVLGFPTSDECPVMSGSNQVGRFNRFANGGFIYWSSSTGAWDVYGAIYAEWSSKGGPLGPLGFPVSGETSTPSVPGFVQGRFNDFQNGVIVWYPDGDYSGPHTVLGVTLYLERYDCSEDFNVQINIEATPASPPNVNHGRMPSGGEYDGGGKELDTILLTVPLVQSNTQVNIWMLCIHEKTFGKDDEEGTVTANYNILNVWGLLENNHAHQDGAFTATFEMQPYPLPPVSYDPDQFRTQLFWPFHNFDTDTLSWRTYSDTFSDVAETDKHVDLNPLDFKLHLFEIAFYNLAYESLGEHGNCFGLCVESIFARENRSLFIEPVFTQNSYDKNGILLATDGTQLMETTSQTASPKDAEIVREANIKQGYQLGVNFLEWFLGKWVTGKLHQPIDAFYQSKQYFESNDWPILSISTGSDFSSSAHTLVPYKWSPSQGGPLTIWVANVNYPAAPPGSVGASNDDPYNFVKINPDNSFTFQMHDGLDQTWFGSPTTGGMLLAIPHSQLNTEPVTPGDAILALIVAGVVIVCAGDAQSNQITDEHGRTFYAYAHEAGAGKFHAERVNVADAMLTRPPSSRRINLDLQTRVPDMARIPLHDGGSPRTNLRSNAVINHHAQSSGALSKPVKRPEIYYLHRSLPFMSMQPTSRAIDGRTEKNVATRSVTPTAEVPAQLGMIGAAAVQILRPHSLAFEMRAQADGSYRWAILSPRMSASITAQCANGDADTIEIDEVSGANQAITFRVSSDSPAKTVSLAVGGFSGGDPNERRWYELLNLNVAPGQAISAQVSNRGGELLLRNTGPTINFELRVHYGMNPAAVAVRPSVSLEANRAFQIAPSEWDPLAMKTTQVQMTLFDVVSGTQVEQFFL